MARPRASEQELMWKKLLACSTELSAESGEGPATTSIAPDAVEFVEKAVAAGAAMQTGMLINFEAYGTTEPHRWSQMPEVCTRARELAESIDDFLSIGNYNGSFEGIRALNALKGLTIDVQDMETRLAFLRLVPLLAENRLSFQEHVSQHEVFIEYLKQLDKNTERNEYSTPLNEFAPPPLLKAYLSAISAICRSSHIAFYTFYKNNGLERFLKLVRKCPDDEVAVRASRIMINIFVTAPEDSRQVVLDTIINMFIKLKARNHLIEQSMTDSALEERQILKDRTRKARAAGQPESVINNDWMTVVDETIDELEKIITEYSFIGVSKRTVVSFSSLREDLDEPHADVEAVWKILRCVAQVEHLREPSDPRPGPIQVEDSQQPGPSTSGPPPAATIPARRGRGRGARTRPGRGK
ncbi:unnamed protein product [Caenorhabditis sp. 36 PRJEB53466]|nr:unnamed protein product [Caenorhabditis sp. 36 PRJEB53466]